MNSVQKEYKEYAQKTYTIMSTSLAAAKKRRAPPPQVSQPSPPPQVSQPSPAPSGLTLPQVIAVVDKRLLSLETSVKTMLDTPTPENTPSNLTEVLDEFNSRFETMAIEIENLKNIILSLQSYTMDVNKMLLEERVRILSASENYEESAISNSI